jgi:hypothetical protein
MPRPDRMDTKLARREAGAAARLALEEFRPTKLPIDPRELAALWEIPVATKTVTEPGVVGYLDYLGNNRFEIVVSDAVDNEGCVNFTIGHELGHCYIEGHVEHLFGNGRTRHVTGAEVDSADLREVQANQFAGEILMPTTLCKPLVIDWDVGNAGLGSIKHLSKACRTSLSATANRYIKLTDLPAAMIVSSGCRVEYCLISEELRDLLGAKYMHPQRGQPLPSHSPSETLARNTTAVERAEEGEELDVAWKDWFGVERGRALEQSKGLGRTGKVLTILTMNDE